MDLVPLLERQYGKTAEWVAGVNQEELGIPTPCSEWDLRTLLNHLIGGNYMFAVAVAGEGTDRSQEPPDFAGEDLTGHYERSSKAALESFRSEGAMERMVTVPIGTFPGAAVCGFALTDAAVHGWDIAKASGQDATLAPEIASSLLALLHTAVAPEFRRPPLSLFEDPVVVSKDASPTDQLVAFLGRRP